jgi:hypothetical protein
MYLGNLLVCLSELSSDLNSLISYYGGVLCLYDPTPGHKEPFIRFCLEWQNSYILPDHEDDGLLHASHLSGFGY